MGNAATGTLVGRLTAGVALVGALAFLTQALVLHFWLSPVLDELGHETAAHAATIATALAAAAPTDRPALARRLSDDRVQVGITPPWGPPPGQDARGPGSPEDPGPGDGPGGAEGAPPALMASSTNRGLDRVQRELQRRLGPDAVVRDGFGPAGPFTLLIGVSVDGQRWWIAFNHQLPRPALFETLLAWLGVLSALVFGALLLSARFVARPIRHLADEISRQRAPLKPIAEHGRGSEELHSLAASFNSLVRVVEAGRQTRQNLLAGLSHDLRTPLARLRLRAETQCEPAVGDALAADLGSLERIVDQFLAYVQLERADAVGRAAPLSSSVEDVVRRHVEHGDPVEAAIAPLDWPMPDLPVQRLVGNLVDNALAYGRAPVRVELVEHEGGGAAARARPRPRHERHRVRAGAAALRAPVAGAQRRRPLRARAGDRGRDRAPVGRRAAPGAGRCHDRHRSDDPAPLSATRTQRCVIFTVFHGALRRFGAPGREDDAGLGGASAADGEKP
ncbi:two-component system osmolarity sensor histidine kinase EnvZ [Rubrivivax gelatinosus]|uniref:histidine kinase n=1 Tax=Rubrivivax gelatinosus TaxID=28068 RepID=A0A4R2MA66_RUBGE|nr:histidine kinase dimerization/phospho-acceptor domain-containing protein [Rubrivivax gelatinosus]TCP03330.1 two-component system osmolarity sensor histidine kinase EnvZ [Rubrivivax gelatinosus]